MMDYFPRTAWDARQAKPGPGPLDPSKVKGLAVHWPGMGDRRIGSLISVASALRGWQAFHMDDRGWSDIAYQVAVDQAGRAWTLRGLRTQSGANGDNAVNEAYGAILLVLGTGEQPSPEMISTVREVVRDFRELYPDGEEIRPHSAVRPAGTGCPGDLARALISSGAFEPGAPTQEDWFDMDKAELQAAVAAGVLEALQTYGKALFADEKGTADTLVDEAREHRKAELARLDAIAANTKPAAPPAPKS